MRCFCQLCLLALLPIFSALMAPLALSSSCEKLNCDCASLSSPAYQSACRTQEIKLQDKCASGQKTLTEWCTVHGLAAQPVAISTEFKSYSASDSVKDDDRKIASLLWSIRQNADFMRSEFKNGRTKQAEDILRISKSNTDTLFEAQNQVVQLWRGKGKDKKVAAAWGGYATDSFELAEYWRAALVDLEKVVPLPTSAAEFGAEQKLMVRLYLLVGDLFEGAGFAFEGDAAYKSASEAWQHAANASANLTTMLIAIGVGDTKLSRYRDMSAARLYRASVLAMMANNLDDAYSLARKAQEYKVNQVLLDEILLEKQAAKEKQASE